MGQQRPLSMLQYNASRMEVSQDHLTLIYSPHSNVPSSGLLCVTCTDLSVLATTNYPEKWRVTQLLTINIFITILLASQTMVECQWKRSIAMKLYMPCDYMPADFLIHDTRHSGLFFTPFRHQHQDTDATSNLCCRYPLTFMYGFSSVWKHPLSKSREFWRLSFAVSIYVVCWFMQLLGKLQRITSVHHAKPSMNSHWGKW